MVEALDTEIGRLLASLEPEVHERTNVVFLGDNGTPQLVTAPPFIPGHGKLMIYDGGINVPLIVSGPQVQGPPRLESALVHVLDVFATVAEVAGVDPQSVLPPGAELDSISLVPYLQGPGARPRRQTVFADMFAPNGFAPNHAKYALRNERYKLLQHKTPLEDELYDLWSDPFELNDLLRLPRLTHAEELAYRSLQDELRAILATP